MNDLKGIWERYDNRLEALENLNRRAAFDAAIDRARRAAARARAWLVIETIVAAITVALIGSFAADHFGDEAIFAAAVVTGAYAIGIFIGNVAQLASSAGVAYDEPVAQAQRRTERALRARIIAVMWTAVLAPLMWLPVVAVLADAIFGVDILRGASLAWILANVAFGVAAGALAIVLLATLARQGKLNVVTQRILADATGRSLRESNAFLRELHGE